jgi:hypothetical protein
MNEYGEAIGRPWIISGTGIQGMIGNIGTTGVMYNANKLYSYNQWISQEQVNFMRYCEQQVFYGNISDLKSYKRFEIKRTINPCIEIL